MGLTDSWEARACQGFTPTGVPQERKAPVGQMLSLEEETYFWVTLAAVSAITYLARWGIGEENSQIACALC
jgi:hypothetical protein